MRSQLVDIQRQQNELLLESYREALDTPRVAEARRALLQQASIEHARNIAGMIEGVEDPGQPSQGAPASPHNNVSPMSQTFAINGGSRSHPY